MKTVKDNWFVFACDTCGYQAGVSHSERTALKTARETARREGWKWFHPHWGLICPRCQKEEAVNIC